MKLENREKLLEHIFTPNMRVCEVGVLVGDFARQMVLTLDPESLVLVDYWNTQPAEVYQGGYAAMMQGEHRTNFLAVCERFSNFHMKSGSVANLAVLKMLSTEAAKLFARETFDLVYLDANHSYEAVKADLHEWWPLVKTGGWIAGHDYTGPHLGVAKAVNEFFPSAFDEQHVSFRDSVHVTSEYEMGSWSIRKSDIGLSSKNVGHQIDWTPAT